MRRLARFAFAVSLRLFPPEFRRAYGAEMLDIFVLRLEGTAADEVARAAVVEICDVVIAACRCRFGRSSYPAYLSGVAVALLVTVVTLHERAGPPIGNWAAAADSIDFRATDPAGAFTLSIRRGKPVGATIDQVPLPRARIVSVGDSIRLLDQDGGVLLSLAFYPELARIEWQARQ